MYLFVPPGTDQPDLFGQVAEDAKARMREAIDRKFLEMTAGAFPQIEPHTEDVAPTMDTLLAGVRKVEQSFKKREALWDLAADLLFPLSHEPGLRSGDIEVYVYTAPESDPISEPGSGYAFVAYRGEWVGGLRSWR